MAHRAAIGCVCLVLVLVACRASTPGGASEMASDPSRSAPMESSSAGCRAAPGWLVGRLQAALTPPGSSATRIFVVPARDLTGGPQVSALTDAWWVAALVNGAGVRPASAAWLVEELDPTSRPTLWAADVNAHRYSTADWIGGELAGDGLATARECVGPPPEP
jgi:hypothetical protein